MIELTQNQLCISFPKVHPAAKMTIDFQRTLRIPDDGKTYPLPASLGTFPCAHVDDFSSKVPAKWLKRGGIMLPMYQSEALWIHFSGHYISDRSAKYPFVVKIAAGKICAVTGKAYTNKLQQIPQDYVVIPEQPWLDGYCVEKGLIRQFIAMPLGEGYTAEEQITGEAEHGGLQIMVYPMKREVFERRFPVKYERLEDRGCFYKNQVLLHQMDSALPSRAMAMGLAPGGRMKQELCEDPFDFSDWDQENSSRCFVHLANSLVWGQITGQEAPDTPITPSAYIRAGLPWFDYYSESNALNGSKTLAKLKSAAELGAEIGENPLAENESITPEHIAILRKGLKKHEVRDSEF